MPFLLAIFLTFHFADSVHAKSEPKKLRKPTQSLEVSGRWQIISQDGQNFSLNSHILDGKKEVFSLSFLRGERELKLLPVQDQTWAQWRNQVAYLISSGLDGKKCSHPLNFIIEKPIGTKKEKSVCPPVSGSDYEEKLKNLILEFNRYLYGS